MNPDATHVPDGEPSYFFDDGLRFECQRCGRCCTGAPGTVRFSEDESLAIAKFLQITHDTFMREFTHRVGGIVSLREREDGACIFYESGCSIYPVRPAQCRTFPFWMKNLRSENAWRETQRSCPGIGTGRLFSRTKILTRIAESPI